MGLPARDEAREWVGWTVVDRDGTELGAVTAVLADESTGRPEWVHVEVEGASAVVPALDADGSDGRVTVAVTRAQVTAAPSVGDVRALSTDQEADLYRHYGIEASSEASETLLPAAVDASGSTGRGTVLAAGALAVVAGIGVVRARARRPVVRQPWPRRLWARRPWAPRPPSRAELIAGQVRTVSVRARRSVRHAARTAGPIAAAAAESARHRAVLAGEGARHVARTTGPIAAAAAESARHRALLGAEQLRHATRLASHTVRTATRT
ncbi:PRC-barrel domain-containing protein [Geodermatophilus obscurus]|uniref:PRC-barrel domain-containing protein n=1 Tax=Geodermatophilus obscurus TaxID=1861 RepID=A0A1M7TJN5_9ACTN|nr:PRC-barrel domain-containing protein [Geodermatophilus obscurus]SHN70931.1 PRC-barrel domain-containing protein [Geodermatophilus obscurus]